MSTSSTISFATEASKNNPDAHNKLLRQGNKFASQEQFSDADRVFRTATSLPGGKPIWNFKSLGFCPSIFPDVSSIALLANRTEMMYNRAGELLEQRDPMGRT